MCHILRSFKLQKIRSFYQLYSTNMSSSSSKERKTSIFLQRLFLIVENLINVNDSFQQVKSNDNTEVRYYILFQVLKKSNEI